MKRWAKNIVFVSHTIVHIKRMKEIKSWAKGDLHFYIWGEIRWGNFMILREVKRSWVINWIPPFGKIQTLLLEKLLIQLFSFAVIKFFCIVTTLVKTLSTSGHYSQHSFIQDFSFFTLYCKNVSIFIFLIVLLFSVAF